MPYTKISEEAYTWEGKGLEAVAVGGKEKVPWRPGLRLTAVRPRSVKSDGEKEDTRWGGMPWVDGDLSNFTAPVGYKVFPYTEIGGVAFRKEAEIFFGGVGRRWSNGELKPEFFWVAEGDIWPITPTYHRGQLLVEVAGFDKLRDEGKLTEAAIYYGRLSVLPDSRKMTEADYEEIGYRKVLGELRPINDVSPAWRPQGAGLELPFTTEKGAVGLRVRSVTAVKRTSIVVSSFVVDDPQLAASHTPWLGEVPAGTGLHFPQWEIAGTFFLEIKDVRSEFLTESEHQLHRGRIEVLPEKITSSIPVPLKGTFNQETVFLGSSEKGLTAVRKLRNFDTSSAVSGKLWVAGEKAPRANTNYVADGDLKKLPKVNAKAISMMLSELKEQYPWATKEHLGNTAKELALEDLFRTTRAAEDDDGWLHLEGYYYGRDGEKRVAEAIAPHFEDDTDVVIKGLSGTLVKIPSYDKLKGRPEAWKAAAAVWMEEHPLIGEFFKDKDTSKALSSGGGDKKGDTSNTEEKKVTLCLPKGTAVRHGGTARGVSI